MQYGLRLRCIADVRDIEVADVSQRSGGNAKTRATTSTVSRLRLPFLSFPSSAPHDLYRWTAETPLFDCFIHDLTIFWTSGLTSLNPSQTHNMSTQPSISSADRIRDLSSISSDIPTLLTSASAALSSLTGQSPDSSTPLSLDASKSAFTEHTQTYFTTLQAVMARLRRQAYALEEAGIIGAEAPVLSGGGSSSAQQIPNSTQGAGVRRNIPAPATGPAQKPGDEVERTTHGGLGNLDVAWLNSRVGKSGLEKEGEVLAEAKRLLEEVMRREGEGRDAHMTTD